MSLSRTHITLFRLLFVVSLITVTYLATTPLDHPAVQDINDKMSHFLAFYVLALLLDFSFPRTVFSAHKIVPLFMYGIVMECVQYFIPYREFSIFDLLADAAGIIIYLASLPLLRRAFFLKRRWGGDG